MQGRAIWDEHAEFAFREGMLTALDILAFGMLCERMGQYIYWRNLMNEEGPIVHAENYTGAHPAAKLMGDTADGVLKLMQQCGQTIASRIGLPKQEKKLPKAGEVVQTKNQFAMG